jgi:small subunit ribosomal protein S20
LANIKASIKQIRQDRRRTARNKPVRSSLKTFVKNARGWIDNGDETTSVEAMRIAVSKLDKAAEKGIIHKNQAARRKSRLMKKFNAKFNSENAE